MRILYFGQFDMHSDCENWICNALVRSDQEVFRFQRKILGRYTLQTPQDWEWFYKNELRAKDIQVMLVNKAPELTPDRISQIRAMGIKVVWWTFDYMLVPGIKEWFVPSARASNMCFMTDGYDSDNAYKNAGIRRLELHQGYDVDMHRPYQHLELSDEDHRTYDCDIAFLGSDYTPMRKELIRFLSQTYGSRFKHWGSGNGLRYGLWGKEFSKAMACSKIIIGDNFVNNVPGYWSDRVYLTLACGGFFLTRYVEGIEKEFTPGKHLDIWHDFEDLKCKIAKYLDNSELRNSIAQAGQDLVLNRDSYDSRVKGVFLPAIARLQ